MIGVSAVRRTAPCPPTRTATPSTTTSPRRATTIFSTIPQQPGRRTRRAAPTSPTRTAGSFEFRDAIGTSFAAPQVSAAAALLLGQRPALTPGPGLLAARAERRRRNARHRAAPVPDRPRRVHGLGHARRRGCADAARRTALPPARPLRAERRRRPVGARAAAAAAHDRRDARLLGRQHRRLPRAPERGPAPLRAADPATARRRSGSPLGARARSTSRASTPTRRSRLAERHRRERRRASRTARRAAGVYYLEAKLVSKTRDPVAYRSLARSAAVLA